MMNAHVNSYRQHLGTEAARIHKSLGLLSRETAHKRIAKIINQAWGTSGMPVIVMDRRHESGAMMWRDMSSWHYETRGGRMIYHPSAYSRSGWSNMVYCASTRGLYVTRRIYDRVLELGDYAATYLDGIIESGGRLSFGGD